MATLLRERFTLWNKHRRPAGRFPISLERRRVYILPNGYGYIYALMLFVIFLWAVNYNNSMGFALVFLLAATALNGMWRCNANLLRLRVHPGRAEAVFAGQTACFRFQVENPTPQQRYGVGLQWHNQPPFFADIPANGSESFMVSIPAPHRGLLRPGRLRILTRFPLGLFQAWSWVEFDHACLVYPRPLGAQPLPISDTATPAEGMLEAGSGNTDFSGLRGYVPGDSPRHIAWKASARTNDLLVKRFTGQSNHKLWLDWRLPVAADKEARLSQLCQWLLQAESEGQNYGLRIPGVEINPASGDHHRHRCLEALALFETG